MIDLIETTKMNENSSRVMALDGTTAEDVIRKRQRDEMNELIDRYSEELEKHSSNVEEMADKVSKNIENIEIMPLGNYVLVKEFKDNPFQRIVRDSKSGLITDIGGLAPQFKNTDSGEIEEEEQFIKVGVVQEVGPECKYLRQGDAVFYPKPACIPVPFYKQQLIQVNETRILAVVNELLTERFNEIKNNK